MAQYILRRLLLIPPTFIGITLIVFTITRFVPGGPVERMIAEMQQNSLQEGGGSTSEMQGGSLSDEQMAQLNEYYGCLLYTSPSPRDLSTSRMPSSA